MSNTNTERINLTITPKNIDDVINTLNKLPDGKGKIYTTRLNELKEEYNLVDNTNEEIKNLNNMEIVDNNNYTTVKTKLETVRSNILSNDRISNSQSGAVVLNQVNKELKDLGTVSNKYEEIESILKELRAYGQ